MSSEILYGNETQGEVKELKAYLPLKTLPANTKIEGKHIGRFQSKKKESVFFHIFETESGERNAYGTCKVLDERVEEFNKVCTEKGWNKNELLMSTTFLGRLPNKNNANTSYKFTKLVIKKPESNEIPF